MKKMMLVLLTVAAFSVAMLAQNYAPTSDVLSAHNNHGRGCAGCHAPHSGPNGAGNKTTDPSTEWSVLWGQDLQPLYGQVLGFGDNSTKAIVVLPSSISGSSFQGGSDPRVTGLLMCLSCHDGSITKGAMMTNSVYETMPAGYAGIPPTLLGKDGTQAGYSNDHPVGENAIVACGTAYTWDCTSVNGVISMTGTASSRFTTVNYGWTVKPSAWNNNAIVVCTTCHNQHVMNVWKGKLPGVQPATGYYKTYFGVNGPYDPGSTTPGANGTTQFCRQCHGGESNEMNNATSVGTTL